VTDTTRCDGIPSRVADGLRGGRFQGRSALTRKLRLGRGWGTPRHLQAGAVSSPTRPRQLLLVVRSAPTDRRLPKCRWATCLFSNTAPLAKSLIEELEHAPESVQREVLAFLRHLRARVAGGDGSENVHGLLPLAESDWVTPEEDGAWRNFQAATWSSCRSRSRSRIFSRASVGTA